jgi:hypothetical protein
MNNLEIYDLKFTASLYFTSLRQNRMGKEVERALCIPLLLSVHCLWVSVPVFQIFQSSVVGPSYSVYVVIVTII